MEAASEALTGMIRNVVEPMGYELVGVEYRAGVHSGVLRIFIDHENGITVEDCAAVSHQVSGVLDVEEPIGGAYDLEVSSPGLDRPLFTAEHYERYSGREAQVRLRAPLNRRRRYSGVLRGVRDDKVILEMEGQEVELPFDMIEQARLVPKFD